MDEGRTEQLVFSAFDLLYLNGNTTAQLPLIERKERLKRLFKKEIQGLRYSEHVATAVPAFVSTPASWVWKASSPSAPTDHTHRATAGSGSNPNASIAKSSWSLDGLTPREAESISVPCCWGITPKTVACTMLVAQAPA
jgi:ATP dependent DNA ligase-like protein